MDRGEAIFLNDPLRDKNRVLKVVAVPGHERDTHVLAQRQLAQINRRSVSENIAASHHIARLHNGALVDTGVLVGTLVFSQVVDVDR